LELVRRRPLVVFFLLAFALTWAVWIPQAMGVEFGGIGRLWTWIGSTGELAYPMLAAAGKWVLVAILVAWAGPRLTCRPSPEALAQPAEQAN